MYFLHDIFFYLSRGPEMLVAFHSSPFSAPLQQGIPNRGFELDVDILFTDSDSYDFAQGSKNLCEFHINATNPGKLMPAINNTFKQINLKHFIKSLNNKGKLCLIKLNVIS